MSADVRAAGGARPWAAEGALLALLGLGLAACAGGPAPPAAVGGGVASQGQPSSRYSGYKVGQPYQVNGVWYTPREQPNYDEVGIASWYGAAFHNHYTADGEVFDMNLPSAAHTTLPLPSLVEVTNLSNGKTLIVRVNDRGPFVDGRIIDLSKEAAAALGFVTAGVTRVRVRYVGRAPDAGGMSARTQIAAAPKAPPVPAAVAPPASRPVQLADAGGQGRAAADYDYASAPKRTNPYGQLARAVEAPVAAVASVPVAVASYSAKAALKAPGIVTAASAPPPPPAATGASASVAALPEVDALLGSRPPAARSTAPAAYELQAGSFATEDAARRFASGLSGGGLPEVQVVHDGAAISYQVVVHGLAGPGEAAAARSEALALGAPRALIVGGS